MGLDGFSMYPLARQLNARLAGGRIDRVFQPNKYTVLLSVRQPGQNLTLHISINSQDSVMNLIERNFDNPPAPPLFCMVLRKQIEDGRIAAVVQHGLDRVISLEIDTLGAGGVIVTKTLTAELMGKYSNLILTQDGRIIDALRKVGGNENRLRQILPGQPYLPPPHQDKINLLTAPPEKWQERLKQFADLPLYKAVMQSSMGFGPVSAREFIWRSGLPKDRLVEELDAADLQALTDAVQEVVRDFKTGEVSPVAILDENKKLLAVSAFRLEHLQTPPVHFATLSEMIDFAAAAVGSYVPPDRDRLKKLVANESAKARKKLENLTEELADAHNAEEYKKKGDILMTYQYQMEDGYIKEVILPNIYSAQPDAEPVKIALDPLLTPAQNMQKYYQRYNKYKRAQESLQVQIRQCEDNIRYLESVENSLENSAAQAEINEIKEEMIISGYLKENRRKKMQEKPSRPYQFVYDDMVILVGKNNSQNDRLTFKTALSSDLWLHAKDIPGSHVVIRCENQQPSPETIRRAAELAAYFSKAKASANVPVDYTRRRYVKKPSGAKPGFVIFTEQKTLCVTPDAAAIESALARQSGEK